VTCEVLRDHQVVRRVSQPVSTTPRMSEIRNLDLYEMDEEFWTGRGHIDFALAFVSFRAIGWYRLEIDEQVATWRHRAVGATRVRRLEAAPLGRAAS
jgi:hypothetical protein